MTIVSTTILFQTVRKLQFKKKRLNLYTEMESVIKWLQSPEAKTIAEAARKKAWIAFLAKYPKADKTKFVAEANFRADNIATAEIFYRKNDGQGTLEGVYGSFSKY